MAHEPILKAKELGIDVVVTDHHTVGETLPEAVAIVNPQRKDCTYPFKGICGAGVAFKLLLAIRMNLRNLGFFENRTEPNLKLYLDLLAIATVCDVVPLKDENRYIVQEGLKVLAQTKRAGLRALLNTCGIGDQVTASDLGFRLGPRINACGRLHDASIGVALLIEDNPEKAHAMAQELSALNQERRNIELGIVNETITQIEETVDLDKTLGLVLFHPEWHLGVVGIVASRITERFKRPTFVLTRGEDGLLKGSGRSISNVSLIDALNACSTYLEKFGGHEAAAGMTIKEEHLEKFENDFDQEVKKQMGFSDLKNFVSIDVDLSSEEISDHLFEELKCLEPHGMGNKRPVFVSTNCQVISKKVVGSDHLKLTVLCGGREISAIAFKRAGDLAEMDNIRGMVFGIEANHFRGVETMQLVVKEFIK